MKKEKNLLERLRISLGLSQSEVAERLELSRPTYVRIEKGEKELTLGQIELLAGLYNVPVEAIRTGRVSNKDIQEKNIVTATIPTKFGVFNFSVWNQPKGDEVVFITTPDFDPHKPVLVRVHSECMTGDVFHSYRCDCGEQKDRAMRILSDYGNGVLIYLRQEGRGIGLYEKVKAYVLQDDGYDTHEANILLGHKPDYREYSWVKKVLNYLHVDEIRLLTNNPSKVSEISRLGIKVIERIPLVIESNIHNRKYFETKKQKFKHFFGKEESNYFYQFSYVESPDQIEEIGLFLNDSKKDPLMKICTGVYGDSHTLDSEKDIKKIESIFKTATMYEGFVPILHFTFKFSSDPIKDIAKIREKMPYVKYIQLNDIDSDHLKIVQYVNKFFLVDIPLSDNDFHLIDNQVFVQEIIKHKAFILLDNSHGTGVQETKSGLVNKINKLLERGISDIAIYGGFGPDSLDNYFSLKEHYKINFSVDAETKLKTNQKLDLEKVKHYLTQLITHK
jgi:3,4-dihydroxy 2-butanone 4-phosphate synthase/GTP cyclohydrolase II